MDALRSMVGLYKPDAEVFLGKLPVPVQGVMGSRNSDLRTPVHYRSAFPCKLIWF